MDCNFKNYRDYCDGFTNENIDLSFLLLLLRENFYKLKKANKIGLLSLCETEIIDDINLLKHDFLSTIAENFLPSFKYINQNISTKLVNANILMPAAKAKNINSYSINWLSRKPGNSVRQKLSNSNNKIMAGKRYHSVDNLENRMFKAVCIKLEVLLSYKLAKLDKVNISPAEIELYYSIIRFKKTDIYGLIGRYEPTPPNNRLLGDRHYKNVRIAWLNIGELDNILALDISKVYEEIGIIFFVGIIQKLSQNFRFPQEIVLINWEKFDFNLLNKKVEFIVFDNDDNYQTCSITLDKNTIKFLVLGDTFTLVFKDNKVSVSCEKNVILSEKITTEFFKLFDKIIDNIFVKTSKKQVNLSHHSTGELPKNLVVDLYAARPKLSSKTSLESKIIHMQQDEYSILLDSNIIPINEQVAITSFDTYFKKNNQLDTKQESSIAELITPIKSSRPRKLTFIYPDKFNEFQLKEFHKNNMHYFSRSMGLVFDMQYSKNFTMQENDFVLAIDYIQENITFTLVKAKFDDIAKEKIPESNGIVWERYPTNSYANDIYKTEVISILKQFKCPDPVILLEKVEVETLLEEKDNLSFKFSKGYFHITTEIVDKIRSIKPINIDALVKDYLQEKSNLIDKAKVKTIYCTDIFTGTKEYDWFEGYEKYEIAHQECKIALWSDYVPALYLKRIEENFVLCNSEDIKLEWGVKHTIELENDFVLASGVSEYEFPLLIGDEIIPTNKAVLKSKKAFPLSEPVTCKLTMIYEYGGEEPFTLVFNSADSFGKIKANFKSITSYQCENMPAPPFPKQSDWELFKFYPKKGSTEDTSDLLDWIERTLEDIEIKNILKIDLKAHNTVWELTGNHKYKCEIYVNQHKIRIMEQFYVDKFDKNRDIIYCSLRDDKYDKNVFLATDITYLFDNINRQVIKKLQKSLFAFHTVFFNSRIIEDETFMYEIEQGFYNLIELLNEQLPFYEHEFYFGVLGLLSHNFDYSCYEIVEKHLENKQNDTIKVGIFLGDISTAKTKDIFKLVLGKYTTNFDIEEKLIPLIANAVWKNEYLIFNIYNFDNKLLFKLFNISIEYISNKVLNIEKLMQENFYHKRLFFSHIEFVLAILRLRELNDSTINLKLSMNDLKVQKLVKVLEKLKESKLEIETFLPIETQKKVENPLLYMLLKYLYNDTLDEIFTILAPSE